MKKNSRELSSSRCKGANLISTVAYYP